MSQREWVDATWQNDVDWQRVESVISKISNPRFHEYMGFLRGIMAAHHTGRLTVEAPDGWDPIEFLCVATTPAQWSGDIFLAYRLPEHGALQIELARLSVGMPSAWPVDLAGDLVWRPFRHAQKLQARLEARV